MPNSATRQPTLYVGRDPRAESVSDGRHSIPAQSRLTSRLACTSLIFPMLLAFGCASHGGFSGIDKCADIPAGAIPEPAGAKVCDWQTAQVLSAAADQTVLYRADFIGPTVELSPAASERLARHAASGLAELQPWVVEPSGDNERDARRVSHVTDRLAALGVTEARVVVAIPAAIGVSGQQMMRATNGLGRLNQRGPATAPLPNPAVVRPNLPGGIF